MCGRTACTLNPDQLSRAASYRNSKGRDVNPKWKKGDADKYRPSYNKAPMSYCPVLLHAKHLDKDAKDKANTDSKDEGEGSEERVIVAMKWGLLPPWVKDLNQAQYKMNNARSDTILTKASYKRPLEKGQRCVLLAEGFYEWNTTKTEKQPYFIFFKDNEADDKASVKLGIKQEQDPPSEENSNPENKKTESADDKTSVKMEVKQEQDASNRDNERTDAADDKASVKMEVIQEQDASNRDNEKTDAADGKTSRIVTMAGIFERRKSADNEEEDLYTFSVITVDAHPAFGWLHHRMPAMLENEEEVRRWLDFGEVPLNDAMELIKPKDCLSWYPVSKIVNNSRNNVPECMERIDLSKSSIAKQSSESKGMAKWLSQSYNKPKADPFQVNNNNIINQDVKKEAKTPTKGQSSPMKSVKSPSKTPKKGQKRPSAGSSLLMEGWLKRAKKEG